MAKTKIPKGGYPPQTQHKYLAVSNPWFGEPQEPVNFGAWLKYMFNKPNLNVEGYYTISNVRWFPLYMLLNDMLTL